MKIYKFLLVTVSLLIAACDTKTITISEWIDQQTYAKIKTAGSTVKTVRIENCLGGDVIESLKIAIEIRSRKIETIAGGMVFSGCALAYLGGTNRKIDIESMPTILAFHGTFDGKNLTPGGAEKSQIVLDILKKNFNFEFSNEIKKVILNTKEQHEAAYFVFDKKTNGQAMYCKGVEKLDAKSCTLIPNVDAFSEKVITESH